MNALISIQELDTASDRLVSVYPEYFRMTRKVSIVSGGHVFRRINYASLP